MKLRLPASILFLVPMLHCAAGLAVAQESAYRFEITPYVAQRTGGTFTSRVDSGELNLQDSDAIGFMLSGTVSPETQWEFLFGRQRTEANVTGSLGAVSVVDLDVDYYHLGGTYLFGDGGFRPFIAATLGISHFDPALADLASENFFSGSLGGGAFIAANKRLGFRLEARLFTTLISDNSNIFCGFDGFTSGCLIEVSGSSTTQWEARAGLVFRF